MKTANINSVTSDISNNKALETLTKRLAVVQENAIRNQLINKRLAKVQAQNSVMLKQLEAAADLVTFEIGGHTVEIDALTMFKSLDVKGYMTSEDFLCKMKDAQQQAFYALAETERQNWEEARRHGFEGTLDAFSVMEAERADFPIPFNFY